MFFTMYNCNFARIKYIIAIYIGIKKKKKIHVHWTIIWSYNSVRITLRSRYISMFDYIISNYYLVNYIKFVEVKCRF